MKTVANSTALNDAIAQMSGRAWRLLRDVHAGRRHDGRDAAESLLRDLTQLARCTGVDLIDVPAYRTNATHWHAIAQLAGASITEQALQAG
jgi:hypothetical protein